MNPQEMSGGVLAFIGDAVMTLKVREYLVSLGYTKSKELQEKSIEFVSARAQADFVRTLLSQLDESEMAIYKRGRNFKSHTIPKNAEVKDYRAATGLEALWGYWHLLKNEERLNDVFARMTKLK